jgi:hypothetical protein
VKVKEEVRAQTDEPTAAHRREKERKKECGQGRQIYKFGLLGVPAWWGNALVACTRARRRGSPLDSIIEAVFARAKNLEARMNKKVDRLQEGAGVCRGCDKIVLWYRG